MYCRGTLPKVYYYMKKIKKQGIRQWKNIFLEGSIGNCYINRGCLEETSHFRLSVCLGF